MKRKTYKDLIGDGKTPNLYWVSLSNDYLYHHDGNMLDWIGDLLKRFTSKGMTVRKPFKTWKGAKAFADTFVLGEVSGKRSNDFIVNRVNIEDRLSGELYERTKVFYPETGEMRDWETRDTRFTKDKMQELGQVFV